MCVIDGHAPACRRNRRVGIAATQISAAAAAAAHPGHQQVMLAIVQHAGFFGFTICFVDESPFGFMKTQIGLSAHNVWPGAAMGEAWMNRVHTIFNALEPVTVLKTLNGYINIAIADKEIISRQERRRLGTKIGEDQATQLFHGIRRQANRFFLEFTVGRLTGSLQQFSLRIVEPAVIATAHTIPFDVAETQVGAAMGAVSTDDSDSSVAAAEQDEIFAEDADERRLGLQMR